MYCMFCGTELPDNAAFCFECGSKLPETKTKKEPAASTTAPAMKEEKSEQKTAPEKPIQVQTLNKEDTEKLQEVDDAEDFYYEEDEEIEETSSETDNKPHVTSTIPTNPQDDPYWDDIVPEVEKELQKIPKDILLKGIGIVVGIFLIILYLVYTLS